MKRLIVLVFACALTSSIFAQSPVRLLKMPLKRTGFSLGIEWDKIQGFSAESFGNMLGLPNMYDELGLDPSTAQIYSGICENPHLRLQAAWQTAMPNVEIVTSAMLVINRYDGITYYGEGSEFDRWDNYMNLHSFGNEAGLDLAIVKRFNKGPFSLQLGLGGNTGFSFSNVVDANGSIANEVSIASFESRGVSRVYFDEADGIYFEAFDVSNGISQRLYGQMGLSATILKRVEIGLEGRWGYGYRWHFDGSPINTNLRSVGAAVRWVMK